MAWDQPLEHIAYRDRYDMYICIFCTLPLREDDIRDQHRTAIAENGRKIWDEIPLVAEMT